MSICLRRREFIAGLGGAAVAWPRSRATACGASARSWRAARTIPRRSLASLRSRKHFRAWVGPMAATCGSTFVGLALTSIGCERSRRSWSACNPTSF
jgi:hypothetical protein